MITRLSPYGTTALRGPRPLHCSGFQITHTTLSKTPLDEVSARAETFTSQHTTSMSLAGLEPAIPATERLQSYALDRAATEIGDCTNAQG